MANIKKGIFCIQ